MKGIEKSWSEFRAKPFPEGYAGVEVEGICLASLDTFSAGCIDTFVGRGRLEQQQISSLKDCLKDLDLVVKHLDGEAKNYFDHLRSLANQVLHLIR